jgi:hypothetical protein
MAISIHPIEQEELMAYLDGEVVAEHATRVAKHLEQCAECRERVMESRAVSEQLTAWQVEPAPSSLIERVTSVLQEGEIKPQNLPPSRSRFPQFTLPRWVWATAGAVCLLLIVAAASIPNLYRSRDSSNRTAASARLMSDSKLMTYSPSVPGYTALPASRSEGKGVLGGLVSDKAESGGGGGGEASPLVTGPMIVRTASLTLLTRDFDKTRAALEEVVRRHCGYNGQLTVSSESGSARNLSATFRVPADQLDAATSEIRQLAHVEQESQGGEEVTEQYVDLAARLSNARRTEQTLLDVLDKRTGKLSEVLEVEQELARVREEIERMQAELKGLQNRVSFSTLQVELHEDYKAQIEISPSVGRRMWNALADGVRSAANSLVELALFFLNVGPFLLLWALILFFPARLVWRRVRAASVPK